MPTLEGKIVQKELELGELWPVYWLHGAEAMKTRELTRRIRRAALGLPPSPREAPSGGGLNDEIIDGAEADAAGIVDAASTLAFGGGIRFLLIRDAHLIKDAEPLVALLGPKGKRESLSSVCVFVSKDLDRRKRFTKALLEKAAVVPCEPVPDGEREAWIAYLAKRRTLVLEPDSVVRLRSLDPWSLDIVDSELAKYETAIGGATDPASREAAAEALLGSAGGAGGAARFVDALLSRDLGAALPLVREFADRPQEAIPLLGLLGWHVRQLVLLLADGRGGRGGGPRLSPFLAERFRRWTPHWTLDDAVRLQGALFEVDFGTKQTPREPLAIWTCLVTGFCREVRPA